MIKEEQVLQCKEEDTFYNVNEAHFLQLKRCTHSTMKKKNAFYNVNEEHILQSNHVSCSSASQH